MILSTYHCNCLVHLSEHTPVYDFNYLASLFLFHTHLEKHQCCSSPILILWHHLRSKNGCRKSSHLVLLTFMTISSNRTLCAALQFYISPSINSLPNLDGVLYAFFLQTSENTTSAPSCSYSLFTEKYGQSIKIFQTPPPFTCVVSCQFE